MPMQAFQNMGDANASIFLPEQGEDQVPEPWRRPWVTRTAPELASCSKRSGPLGKTHVQDLLNEHPEEENHEAGENARKDAEYRELRGSIEGRQGRSKGANLEAGAQKAQSFDQRIQHRLAFQKEGVPRSSLADLPGHDEPRACERRLVDAGGFAKIPSPLRVLRPRGP